jgi:hypothetical protein
MPKSLAKSVGRPLSGGRRAFDRRPAPAEYTLEARSAFRLTRTEVPHAR